MTTASKLTLLRVFMIPAFMAVFLLGNHWLALGIFVIAALTDFVDGYIARHYNQVSDFGKFLDPLADKLLTVSAMLIFLEWGRMPSWAVMLILTREFAVTGLRLVAVQGGKVIAAGWSGKIKTASSMFGLCLMMAFMDIPLLDTIVTWVIVITTVYSGIEYFVQNRKVLSFKKS